MWDLETIKRMNDEAVEKALAAACAKCQFRDTCPRAKKEEKKVD